MNRYAVKKIHATRLSLLVQWQQMKTNVRVRGLRIAGIIFCVAIFYFWITKPSHDATLQNQMQELNTATLQNQLPKLNTFVFIPTFPRPNGKSYYKDTVCSLPKNVKVFLFTPQIDEIASEIQCENTEQEVSVTLVYIPDIKPFLRVKQFNFGDSDSRILWRSSLSFSYYFMLDYFSKFASSNSTLITLEDDIELQNVDKFESFKKAISEKEYITAVLNTYSRHEESVLDWNGDGALGMIWNVKFIAPMKVCIKINYDFEPVDWLIRDCGRKLGLQKNFDPFLAPSMPLVKHQEAQTSRTENYRTIFYEVTERKKGKFDESFLQETESATKLSN